MLISFVAILTFLVVLVNSIVSKNDDSTCSAKSENWQEISINETSAEAINWHDYLSFYWNTPILHSSEDPVMRPMIEKCIFELIDNGTFIDNIINFDEIYSHFGNIYNVTGIIKMKSSKVNNCFIQFLDFYQKRIVDWMTLYTRNEAYINHNNNDIFLLSLNSGDTIGINGISLIKSLMDDNSNNNNDLISILSLNKLICNHNENDGIFLFDPRGSVSGYGFGDLIQTSQHQHLSLNGGNIVIFPSNLEFVMLPIECKRYFLISFAQIHSKQSKQSKYNRNKKKNKNKNKNKNKEGAAAAAAAAGKGSGQKQGEERETRETGETGETGETREKGTEGEGEEKKEDDTCSKDEKEKEEEEEFGNMVSSIDFESIYKSKNDQPYWEQNIGLFSLFGTPIFRNNITSISITKKLNDKKVNQRHLDIFSQCILHLSNNIRTIRKSNRGKESWQSKAYLFRSKFNTTVFDNNDSNSKTNININISKSVCESSLFVIENFVYESILLWILSFRNSYYYDDNGIYIKISDGNIIGITIENSWANVNSGNFASNMAHLHSGYHLSGVFYINVPQCDADSKGRKCDGNEGNIMFKDPRNRLFESNSLNKLNFTFGQFNQALKILPKNGDIILFPAWLHHWVMPSYNSEKERISIAFNINFAKLLPNGTMPNDVLFLRPS